MYEIALNSTCSMSEVSATAMCCRSQVFLDNIDIDVLLPPTFFWTAMPIGQGPMAHGLLTH